jgi:hypothetical protein
LDLTSGYEQSHYHMALSQTLPLSASDLHWKASGSFDVDTSSATVPVELSTNLRVLVATLYGGVGLDIRGQSKATTDAELGGPLTVSFENTEQNLGTVTASLRSTGYAEAYAPRLFGGVQLNILMVKVYGHVNWGVAENSFGGHLGVRVSL